MNEFRLRPVLDHETPIKLAGLDKDVKLVVLPNFGQFGKFNFFLSELVELRYNNYYNDSSRHTYLVQLERINSKNSQIIVPN